MAGLRASKPLFPYFCSKSMQDAWRERGSFLGSQGLGFFFLFHSSSRVSGASPPGVNTGLVRGSAASPQPPLAVPVPPCSSPVVLLAAPPAPPGAGRAAPRAPSPAVPGGAPTPPVTEGFESIFRRRAVQEPQSRGSAARVGGSEPLPQPEPPSCPFLSRLQMCFFAPLSS